MAIQLQRDSHCSLKRQSVLAAVLVVIASHLVAVVSADERKDLLGAIVAEYPILGEEDGNDFNKVRSIADYAYRNTPWVYSGESKLYELGTNEVNRLRSGESTVEETFRFFSNDGGALSCGGVAHITRNLLERFGYQAWYLDIGFSPPSASGSHFTHALVLVEISHEDKPIYCVVDPTTNTTYVDAATGQPIDYFRMLRLLWQRRADEIAQVKFADGTDRPRPVLLIDNTVDGWRDEPTPERVKDLLVDENNLSVDQAANGWWKVTSHRPLERLEAAGEDWWHRELEREGFPGESIYLLGLPFGVSENGGEMLARMRDVIGEAGGPKPGDSLYQ